MDQNQERRRGHFHRGRRGPDRRGFERRTQQPAQEKAGRDQADVEQIMRDIRARIAQHGVDLSSQQVQELAAKRLEAILDPRMVNASLLEHVRNAAGVPPQRESSATADSAYTFDDHSIYDSPRGLTRLLRRLLNPLLKLFFNPAPIARALSIQARINVDAVQREAERERRQTEWNALQYEIVQRLVTEVSRASIEHQSLAGRFESLAAKVDFNERRVRGIEGRGASRPDARPAEAPGVIAASSESNVGPQGHALAEDTSLATPSEGAKRRRRRRRGRRGAGAPGEAPYPGGQPGTPPAAPAEGVSSIALDADTGEQGDDDAESELVAEAATLSSAQPQPAVAQDLAMDAPQPVPPLADHDRSEPSE